MSTIAAVGAATAIGAYSQSKEKMWLWGGVALASIIPYTFIFMKKTNSRLYSILKESGTDEELKAPIKEEATNRMKSWINLHRVRMALAFTSAAIFFVAKQYTKST